MSIADDTKDARSRGQGARLAVVGEEAGQRIDNYLARLLKDVPKSRIYKMIRKGEVRVNGGRVKPTYRLQSADQVRIPPHHARPEAQPTFIGERQLAQLEGAILYEDKRLLVLNKPAGLAVHGGSGVAFGAIEALRRLRPDAELELVHRLDRDTSGCLLVAKKRSMLRALHDELRTGGLKKTYLLIVHGRWPAQLTSVDTALTKYIAGNGERRVKADPGGKASRTGFRIEAQAGSATLLQATLHTGRTHQIRVHAKTSGHSIVGDEKYATAEELAADQALGVRRLCLHAGHVGIPTEAGLQTFDAPLPEDFQAAWRKLSLLAVTENG